MRGGMERQRSDGSRLARLPLPPMQKHNEKGETIMMDVLFALIFMALGAVISHFSWLRAWNMYRTGKTEGQCGAIRNNNECRRAQK